MNSSTPSTANPAEPPTAPAAAARRTGRTWLFALLLLGAFVAQATTSLTRKSVTVDEITYVTAGYVHLATGSFDFNATNPPLIKMLAAAPLLALDPQPTLPPVDAGPWANQPVADWNEVTQWRYARAFFYDNATADHATILFWSRLPIVALGALLGLVLFVWTRRVHGDRGALVALTLFAFSPNLLAHARLATQDLGVTALLFFAAAAAARFADRPTFVRAAATGALAGAAVLAKTTAIFLAPILGLFVVTLVVGGGRRTVDGGVPAVWSKMPFVARFGDDRPRTRQLVSIAWAGLVISLVALVVINAGYAFSGTGQAMSAITTPEKVAAKLPIGTGVAELLLKLPSPLPEPFWNLVRFQAGRVAEGNPMYLHGELSRQGWYHMMIVTLAIKLPIAMLLLGAIGLLSLPFGRRTSSDWMCAIAATVLLALFSYLKKVNIGLRYVLPMLPFVLFLVGRLFRGTHPLPRWTHAALALLLTWQAVGTLWLWPNHLAHFNELVGGPRNGHRWLVDSNLDWGQDLDALGAWMAENDVERVRLAWFGSADATAHGIDYDYLPSVGLAPTADGQLWWYEPGGMEPPPLELDGPPIAISASLWAGIFYPRYYRPLHALEPVAQVGHSILIYDPSDTLPTARRQ